MDSPPPLHCWHCVPASLHPLPPVERNWYLSRWAPLPPPPPSHSHTSFLSRCSYLLYLDFLGFLCTVSLEPHAGLMSGDKRKVGNQTGGCAPPCHKALFSLCLLTLDWAVWKQCSLIPGEPTGWVHSAQPFHHPLPCITELIQAVSPRPWNRRGCWGK